MNLAVDGRLRIGIVPYLNTRPLTECLPELLPRAQFVIDVPSGLAERLASGRLDVGIVPVVEWFRHPEWQLVSDACIACRGPVRSVRLFGRTDPEKIQVLAADQASRTSVALCQILLAERFGSYPVLTTLPLECPLEESLADAVLLIGDRAMSTSEEGWQFVWDLGAEWNRWTGFPFVFAVWLARPELPVAPLHEVFGRARDAGLSRLWQKAADHAPRIGWIPQECKTYLEGNLWFYLDEMARKGLELFRRLAGEYQHRPTRSAESPQISP